MGMSSYILDLEDKFQYEEVPNIVKDCDCVEEAINRSEEKRQKEYSFISPNGLDDMVTDQWNEYWSKYN